MKKRWYVLAIAAVFLFTGCGAGSKTADSAAENSAGSYYGSDMGFTTDYAMAEESVEWESTDAAAMGERQEYSQKLIRTYNYTFETTEFDRSVAYIDEIVSEYNGYIESSEVSGYTNRYAMFTIRIPEEKADAFLGEVGSIGEVIRQSSSTEDITLSYYDATARLESLNAQHERLLELMEQASSLEDIVSLESELADVEYEINSYNTTLRVYDNLVNYVTINLNLDEVEQIQVVEDDGVWTQIKKGLTRNTSSVINGLLACVVFVVSAIPYLLVIAVIVLLIVLFIKKIKKNHAKKVAKRAQQAQQTQQVQ